jgi:hypothetical protein
MPVATDIMTKTATMDNRAPYASHATPTTSLDIMLPSTEHVAAAASPWFVTFSTESLMDNWSGDGANHRNMPQNMDTSET